MNFIDYRDLPHQTNLFLDYIYDFEKVSKYYNGNFQSNDDIERAINLAKRRSIDREALVKILLQQNKKYNDSKALENIDLLNDENTIAVVTGQQVGMYSGPLYTIYKIITAIKMADKLNAEHEGTKFVPIFWLEGEDHDFLEINKIKIIDKQNNHFTHEYFPEGKPTDRNLGASGEIILDSFIDQLNENLLNTLSPTEFQDDLQNLLKNSYKSGNSILDSFCTFISGILKDSGLIFFNPNTIEIKKILKPIYRKEITEYPKTSELIINLSAELEEVYHAQVKARPINLFFFHPKGRYLIEPNNDDFSLKGIRQKYTKQELMDLLETSPQLFSSNVILRPICQDFLLPTFCYIGGPSEIAYFAQFKPVYEHFNISMPLIYPRATLTIIENKIKKILQKYNLEVNDFFIKYDAILRKVSEDISNIKIDEVFEELHTKMDLIFGELKKDTEEIDKTLFGALDNSNEKIEHTLSLFKEKLIEAQKRNNKIALEQIGKARFNIYPKDNFQEREINITYFLNKYSSRFIEKLFEEIKIDFYNHQLIEL